MRKITVLLILLSVFYINTFAQSGYFNNIFHINGLWSYGRSIVYKDSNYYVSALSYDTIYSIYAVRRLSLCKFDKNGDLILRKYIGWGERHYWVGFSGCLQPTSDNNFISVGVVSDTNEANAYLVKFNTNLDTIFFREYKDTIVNHIQFYQGIETNDKGYIMIGVRASSAAYNQDVFVLKTDSLGNEQWRKVINLGSYDSGFNIIQTPDKGFLLGCYNIDVNDNNSGDGRILKLDSLGNFEWGKMIGGPKADGVPIVALAKDSNYIVVSAYSYKTIFGFPEACEFRTQVVKMDKTDGSIIWNKQYDTIRRAIEPTMVKADSDDNLIIIGNYYSQEIVGIYGKAWLLKINQNGDSLLYRQFYKSNNSHTMSNYVYDFCITEDKSMVTCGYLDLDTAYTYLWLAKMDSLGCLQPGCQYVGVEELQKAKEGELKVYPNPATTQATITYPTAEKVIMLQIYNMLGQKIYEEKLSKGSMQTTIDTRAYKKGLYKVVVGESSASLIIN